MSSVRIGTRGSPLALWQAHHVRDRISALDASLEVQLEIIKTSGDQAISARRYGMLDKGMFTSEIENALRAGTVDVAVHSLKDLPTVLGEGVSLAAVTERDDPADALIAGEGLTLDRLPQGATVLTGSLRRRGQLLHYRPDLHVRAVRGNVQTRLRTLDESDADAMVLARAGLVRSRLDDRIAQRLDPTVFLPACGQGALGIEVRADDGRIHKLLSPLEHPRTRQSVSAERAVLTALGGGCQVPVGAFARFDGEADTMILTAMLCELYGGLRLCETLSAPVADVAAAEQLGRDMGRLFEQKGGGDILARVAEQLQAEWESPS